MSERSQDLTSGLLRASTLETLGKLAAVVGVLLPVAGALYREIAFQLTGRIPFGLGATLPLSQLAAMGAAVVLPGLVTGLLLAWIVRVPFDLRIPHPPRLEGLSRQRKLLAVAVYAGFLFILLAIGLTLLGQGIRAADQSVNGLLGFILAMGVIFWSSRVGRFTGRIPLSRLVPVVLVVVLVSALGASVGPTTAGTALVDVQFTSATGLTNGPYTILGEDDSTTWLLPCATGAAPLRVRSTYIVSMAVQPFASVPAGRTVNDVLRLGLGPGLVQRCP